MASCPKCDRNYSEDTQFCPDDGVQLVPDEALPPEDADMEEGSMVGEYKVQGLLGKGGFGTVYRGVHPLIGKKVAIKVLHRQLSSNRNMVSRFISEARAVNQIGHRNIIDIFAFGQLPDGRQYYIMELVNGVSLERYLRSRGRLHPQEAIPILRAVGRALDAAHGAGIAHRDLKPENIVVCADEGKPYPKLLDFGIAKLMGSGDGLSYKTQTGTPMGTPAYMSPEQCLGRNVDHRTDVYAFGVMTYQLLTGKLPFTGESFVEIVVKQTSHDPLSPSQICEDIPEPLSSAILWMLRKDPNERPQTLAAAVARLEEGASAMGLAVHTGVTRMPEQLLEMNRPMGMATPAGSTGATGSSPSMGQAGASRGASLGGTASGGGAASAKPAFTPVAAGEMAAPREFEELPARGGRGKWMALAAAVLLLAGGGAVVAMRSGGDGASVAAQQPPAGPRLVPAETPPLPTAPETPPVVPEPTVTPVTAPSVTLTVSGAPDGTEVRDDAGTLLGKVPGKLKLPRGDAPLALHFEHSGYEPLVEKPSVAQDGTLAVKMHREKKKQAATTPAQTTTGKPTAGKPTADRPGAPDKPVTPDKPTPDKPAANPLPDF